MLLGFWAARMIADTNAAFGSFESVFTGTFGNWPAIVLQGLGLASIVVLYKLPWPGWLRRYIERDKSSRASNGRRRTAGGTT